MTLNEHIDYWIKSSRDDYEVFTVLLNSKNYLHALFIAHLSIEKLLKAHWVQDNNNTFPPKIHNLVNLVKQTKLDLSHDQLVFLTSLNDFQLQGRYPDYKFKINKLLSESYMQIIVPQINDIYKCLLEKIT